MGTGFSVSQGMVVIGQIIAAGRCHCLQLVVWQTAAVVLPRGRKGIEELVIRVAHLVDTEHLFQASFVKRTVMRHQRQALNLRGNLLPHIREHRGVFRVLLR